MITATLFISLMVFLILNVPVGIAIGLSSLATLMVDGHLSLTYMCQQLVTATDSFTLMAIPLFILAGELMASGGVSEELLKVANVFFGKMWGGLAIVTVAVCMFFAAVSGSGPATVAAVGGMVVPTMLKKGYSKEFTLALIACAGSIGVIIPPSIPMVIYGSVTGTSITGMFMAGFLPGILIGISLMIYSYIVSKKNGWGGDIVEMTVEEKLKVIGHAFFALIDPIIILGGIYGGVFTPTEAAAVAAVYAFFCGTVIYKKLNLKNILPTIGKACSTNGTTMVIIGCATAFTKILTLQRIPQMITDAILGLTDSRVLVLVFINILLLFVGCFMDTTPAMMVLAPILLPVAQKFGLSAIHFGIIMVVNLSIGFITPPLGINLFVSARVGDSKLEVVIRGIIQFIIINIVDLMLITYIPMISELLPRLAGILR